MQEPSDDRGSDTPAEPKRRRSLGWAVAPVLIFVGLVGLFAFALETGDPSKLPSTLIGKPVPATTFPAVDGLTDGNRQVPGFASADLANGKVSVVNFWASWCVACIEEHPLLEVLKKRTGVDIYGVDYKDQATAARRFLGRYGNPFTAVGTDANGRSAIEWGVYGMPETFVLNGKGEIVYKHIGPVSPQSLQEKLIPAIEQARAPSPAASVP